jgi:hypothetical protein
MSEIGMGLFGHVPTPDEINARAFTLPRQAQPEGWWPGYVAGLRDAGAIYDEEAKQLLFAALDGQFAHNVEPIFNDELEGCDE